MHSGRGSDGGRLVDPTMCFILAPDTLSGSVGWPPLGASKTKKREHVTRRYPPAKTESYRRYT